MATIQQKSQVRVPATRGSEALEAKVIRAAGRIPVDAIVGRAELPCIFLGASQVFKDQRFKVTADLFAPTFWENIVQEDCNTPTLITRILSNASPSRE